MESLNTESNAKETPEPRRPATFFGTAYHKVSAKTNQVAMPKHFLKAINNSGEGQLLLVRWNSESYLRLYTQQKMDERIEKIQARTDLTQQEIVELTRDVSGSAIPIEPDSQGRFVLPSEWVEELGLHEEVAFCGAHKRIEIWPAKARREIDRKQSDRIKEAKAKVTEILDL
jgi:DNA-binding transcriptional regulator/RsmH inhibitor MraZ